MSSWYQMLVSPGMQRFSSRGGMWLATLDEAKSSLIDIQFEPDYNAGKRIRASEAITVDSDVRLKQDIAEIDQGEALFDLIPPKQYRMRAAPECLHFGYIAQHAKAALDKLGIPETVMVSDVVKEDGYMGLNYQEFIALTAHKVRCLESRHAARIDALEQRITELEEARDK